MHRPASLYGDRISPPGEQARRKALPSIAEDAVLLKPRLQGERDGRKRPRLQMLDLWARGPAHTRHAVAQLLGVHRHTVGHWLAIEEAGGLEALLVRYVPAGKPLSRPPDVLAALEQALRQPAGVASDAALRQGVKQTPQLAMNYHTLYAIVRTRFKTTRKGPRPSPTKRP